MAEAIDMISPAGLQKVPADKVVQKKSLGWTVYVQKVRHGSPEELKKKFEDTKPSGFPSSSEEEVEDKPKSKKKKWGKGK